MHRLFIMMALVLITTPLHAITPEELAHLSEKGAADKRRVDQQLNLKDLHYKLRIESVEQSAASPEHAVHKSNELKTSAAQPAGKENEMMVGKTVDKKNDKQKRQATKYSKHRQQEEHPQNKRHAKRQVTRSSYAASPQHAPAYATVNVPKKYETYSDAVEPDNKQYFGIRRGTWIKAALRRDINNAEPGDVELYLSHEIHGTKHTLPVDTQLFANKGLNTATQRLDMLTTYAITPSGREFILKARIYDTFKVSGLTGIIDADDSKIAMSGVIGGLAALGSGVLKEVSGGSVVGQALNEGGQSIINDQSHVARLETEQQITIFVAPQSILLRVEETF